MKILSKPFVASVIAWKQVNNFSKAKIKLTFYYVSILFFLLNLFVFSLYFLVEKNFEISLSNFESSWENHVTISSKNPSVHIIEWQKNPQNFMSKQFFLDFMNKFVVHFRKTIFLLEIGLLFFSGILSYFLASVTLFPIRKKMQQQNEFLADVSHEIKNPLSALQTTTEVALKNSKWTKQEQTEFLSDFLVEIKRLITLNSDLLFLENMDGNKSKFSVVDLSKILKNSMARTQVFALKKKINVISKIDSNCFIEGVEIELERLFFNLLHNAIKFTLAHKKVILEAKKEGRNVVVKVMDEGIGIDNDLREKIFSRFYKIDTSRGFEDSGVGLGLSIVKKVVRHHKAKIFVESQKKGTCFKLVFELVE